MVVHMPTEMIEAVAAHLGVAERAVRVQPVAGGDINEAAKIVLPGGERYFLKWNRSAPPGMFEAEVDGLTAIAAIAGDDLVVPGVRGHGDTGGVAWLLMDHIESARIPVSAAVPSWAVRLGRGLAALHRASAGPWAARASVGVPDGAYGWRRDNYIGRLPQANAPSADWPAFWRERRIEPQVRRAADAGLLSGAGLNDVARLVERTDEALVGTEADGPSLLHGDLWGGNVMAAADGRAALYDPAVYRGHREVDLAMSELFGFPAEFMPAYREAWPVDPEYDAHRRDMSSSTTCWCT
jgi:fructosamine-3-kinase